MAWILAIGGTDSSGGAGIDADRDAAEQAGVRLQAVVTAATEQSDQAVRSVNPTAPDRWLFEALSAMAVENPGAIKFGLLPGPDHLSAALSVIDQVRFEAPQLSIVLDPVLASSSGYPFVEAAAFEPLLRRPLILTPNLPEAAALTGAPLELLRTDRGACLAAAQTLLLRGLQAVLLKGGHGAEPQSTDLLLRRGQAPLWLSRERLPGPGIRGSGCRLASSLAAHLALGLALPQAVERAADFVAGRIAESC